MTADVVDVHAHLYAPEWYSAAFADVLVADVVARQGGGGRAVLRLLTDRTGDQTLRVMDRVGIARRVLAVLDWGLTFGEADRSIRDIHTDILGICARFPDRFVGLAGVDPRRPDALALLQWAVEVHGARGLKLHPTSAWTLDDAAVDRLVGYCAEHGLMVLVHTGRTMAALSDRHARPPALIALAHRHPGARFLAGHSGFESWPEFFASPVPDNLHFDIGGWQAYHAESAAGVGEAIAGLVAAAPGRVGFATDSPFFSFNLPTSEAAWLRTVGAAPVPPAALARLFHGGILGEWL